MVVNRLGESISLSGEIDSDFKAGPIELIGIQPTLFCNINCSYCFLSEEDRASPKKITFELIEQIAQRVFSSGLVNGAFTISWAASEPLTLKPEFYEKAFALIEKHNTSKTKIVHAFTTNATLITEEWCEFFKKHEIYLAVSIDGPAFIHDKCRVTRTGKGTHQRAMEGVRLLRKHKFPFACISVLTDYALDYPDEMYDFFRAEKIGGTAFNFDEADGVNPLSSMHGTVGIERYERFFSRFYDIVRGDQSKFWVREFDKEKSIFTNEEVANIKLNGKNGYYSPNNQCVIPFALLNIDCQGNFSTFTPELLGTKSREYGDFYFGRIQDHAIESVIHTEKFKNIWRSIAAGIRKCYDACPEFAFCGGGSPSNKYVENGTFDSTETQHCRICTKSRVKLMQEKKFGGPQVTSGLL
jgi:uncharacterized protein